jgi:hypothetical protein
MRQNNKSIRSADVMMNEFIGTAILDGEIEKIYLNYEKHGFSITTNGGNNVLEWFTTKRAALKYCKDVLNILNIKHGTS